MNKETDDRIKKMEKLIKDEAEEKARTIRENAEQQYNIEKNKIINQMKEKVLQEFREKLENYSVQKRIERSSKINNSRIKKMEQRFAVINKVREEAATKLRSQLSDPSIHKPLMKKLIIQVRDSDNEEHDEILLLRFHSAYFRVSSSLWRRRFF
eukprot:TRINITY_DN632_c0_g1_i1.p1 TRINITY_DN632_c0_g1~~TRINITY_DN632_c0_g1_i1.p1  ORF type:complete len:154 (+),score=64.67 TRINITY_DN632_c0_g1_i1:161-622(+)